MHQSADANGKILSGPGRTYDAPSAGLKLKPVVHMPSKKIMKAVGQAIKDWNMIEDGDRLLLGLSGGKDSLALLHILLAVQVRVVSLCAWEESYAYAYAFPCMCFCCSVSDFVFVKILLVETCPGEVRDRLRHGGSADGLIRP